MSLSTAFRKGFKGGFLMKYLLWSCVVISFLFWVPACSKKQIKSVLDDISRDTYENNLRKHRIENIKDPNYEEPPSYDQYQRERKKILMRSSDIKK